MTPEKRDGLIGLGWSLAFLLGSLSVLAPIFIKPWVEDQWTQLLLSGAQLSGLAYLLGCVTTLLMATAGDRHEKRKSRRGE